MKICHAEQCNMVLSGKQRKYCSNKCKHNMINNKFQNYKAQQNRGTRRKIELVILKGGKCQRCGYFKNLSALCFHHRNESDKRMKLTIRELSNNNVQALMDEVEKCDLLCHNCHMEIHHSQHDDWWDCPDSNRKPTTYEVVALTN